MTFSSPIAARGQGAFDRPAISGNATPDRSGCQAGHVSPLRGSQRSAIPLVTRHAPAIVDLLTLCRPANVARLVVAVHVDPIKRMGRRGSPADISEEHDEVVRPLSAHRDAAATVQMELAVPGVGAATLRARPRPVLRTPRRAGLAVAERRRDGAAEAAAALDVPVGHLPGVCGVTTSTLAQKQPVAFSQVLQASETTEAFTEHVELHGHRHG